LKGFHSSYEYWPTRAFYWPIYIWGPFQAMRAGHPCFFTTINPNWEGGGIGFESKHGILQDIPSHLRPNSIRVIPQKDISGQLSIMTDRYPNEVTVGAELSADTVPAIDFSQVLSFLREAHVTFPLIAKPDVGFRGRLVRKIRDEQALKSYLKHNPIPTILQEFIDLPEEVGILYYRIPGQKKGHISSITTKAFLSVTGNGTSTLRALILEKDRAKRQLSRIEKELGQQLDSYVPTRKEIVNLGEIGNHSKGTAFIDNRSMITPELTALFDRLADQIPGFNYGRIDLKYENWQALLRGEMKILEINGALAEPTHIYDPSKNTYFSAVKDILRHWYIIGTISRAQIRRGQQPMPLRIMLQKLAAMKRYIRVLKELDEGY